MDFLNKSGLARLWNRIVSVFATKKYVDDAISEIPMPDVGDDTKLYRHKIRLYSDYFEFDYTEVQASLDIIAYTSRQEPFTNVNDLDDDILDEVRHTSVLQVDGAYRQVSYVSNSVIYPDTFEGIEDLTDAFQINTFYDGDPTDGWLVLPKSEFRVTDTVMEV